MVDVTTYAGGNNMSAANMVVGQHGIVKKVEQTTDRDGKPKLKLEVMSETGMVYGIYLNKESVRNLIAALGKESDLWTGKKIKVMRIDSTKFGKSAVWG